MNSFKRTATITSTVIVLALGLWAYATARERKERDHAVVFCESIIPQLRDAKQATGAYPITLSARTMELPRADSFQKLRGDYSGHPDFFTFRLHFRTAFWDRILEYNSSLGRWLYLD